MPPYKENLVKHLTSFKDELCEDCNRRILTNPIRVLDCKNEHCQSLLNDAPLLNQNLCSSCQKDFEILQSVLKENGV
ncbi:histidyl-tRNA synthase, partial [Vibrio parahaemolyticus]